jgi:hypothetical protein
MSRVLTHGAGLNITPDPGRVNCRSCRKFNLPSCTECHFCQDCCTCRMCEDCNVKHPASRHCSKCGVCSKSGKCQCGSRKGEIDISRYVLGEPNLHRLRTTPSRCTTVELELSKFTPLSTRFTWGSCRVDFHRDGTIRGSNPTELVLGPIAGTQLGKFQKELTSWLKKSAAEVNTSCGMHVHVDARRLDPFGMRRLLWLYKVLEPTFYSLCDKRRVTNVHCSPISPLQWAGYALGDESSTSHLIKEALLIGTYVGELPPAGFDRGLLCRELAQNRAAGHGNNGREPNRYRSLNIHSWFYRGTLEFRQHEGCVDPQRILNWMEFCRWTVELAQRLRDCEVRDVRTPQQFLQGSWTRPYGTLSLPQSVREYVAGGPAQPLRTWDEEQNEVQQGAQARLRAQEEELRRELRATRPTPQPNQARLAIDPNPVPRFIWADIDPVRPPQRARATNPVNLREEN